MVGCGPHGEELRLGRSSGTTATDSRRGVVERAPFVSANLMEVDRVEISPVQGDRRRGKTCR